MLEIAVCFGMHRDGLDVEFPAGAQDAQGNFATVGDEDFTDHVVILVGGSWEGAGSLSFDDEKRLVVFHGLPVFDQYLGDLAGFVRLDRIENFHRLDDAQGVT